MSKRTAWGILSGKLLLPFTIRPTRERAMIDYCNKRRLTSGTMKGISVSVFEECYPGHHPVKLRITWKKL